MQQALYSTPAVKTIGVKTIGVKTIAVKTAHKATGPKVAPKASRPSLARHMAQRWDLYGVLAVMASSTAYALAALARLA